MSRTRAFRLGTFVVASVAVLSACSSHTAGTPSTSGTGSPSASGPSRSAPPVPGALPTDALIANPCNGLSASQITTVGLAVPGAESQSDTGPTCKWRSAVFQLNVVYISPMTVNKNGLSDIYATKGNFAYFEPTTVDDYPGVYASPTDNRSGGDCQLWVGVSDELSVSVSAQIGEGPNKTNPCPATERVATAMIDHLQGRE